MNLSARIKRLEAIVGKGQRYCVYCRCRLRNSLSDPKKPKTPLLAEDVIKGRCEFCLSEYTIDLAEKSEEERQVIRLKYSFTLEDHYRNPKAHAFNLWLAYQPEHKRLEKHAKAKKLSDDPNALIRKKLQEEMQDLISRKCKRLRAKYGDLTFLEHLQLIKSVQNRALKKRDSKVYVKGLWDLEKNQIKHMIRAELEKIIWGETRPSTASAIEEIEREIDELIRTTGETKERSEEEAKRKNLEFLNRNRAALGLLLPLLDKH